MLLILWQSDLAAMQLDRPHPESKTLSGGQMKRARPALPVGAALFAIANKAAPTGRAGRARFIWPPDKVFDSGWGRSSCMAARSDCHRISNMRVGSVRRVRLPPRDHSRSRGFGSSKP